MMTTIITVGNSKGIRIPKVLLEESGLEKEVELKVKKGEIRIIPAIRRKVRNTTSFLSAKALATDWNRKEEDRAWKTYQ